MKKIIFALLTFLIPINVYSDVSIQAFALAKKQALETVFSFEAFQVRNAILVLANYDKFIKTDLSEDKIKALSHSVAIAHEISGVDWKLILAILYVESKLCHKDWLMGDKHLNKYKSFGCMQVHMNWWGEKLMAAGITKSDLLDYDIGIVTGAMILADKIDRYGFDGGIRRYNGSGQAAEVYRKKVMKIYRLIEPWYNL